MDHKKRLVTAEEKTKANEKEIADVKGTLETIRKENREDHQKIFDKLEELC